MDQSTHESHQRRLLFAFSIPAVFYLVSSVTSTVSSIAGGVGSFLGDLVFSALGLVFGGILNIDFFGIFQNIWEWFMNRLVTAFFDVIGQFFLISTEAFLLYENPRYNDRLNEYWIDGLVIYLFLVFALTLAYYVVMMLLADTEQADIQRIVERMLISAILLSLSREIYGFFVELTNVMTYHILPDSYTFRVATDLLGAAADVVGITIAMVLIAIFAGFGVLITGILFMFILVMRILIIYVVYAALPVLLALWIYDVGPLKYGNSFAKIMFKAAAVMMLLGFVIGGILAVGAAFGEEMGTEGVEMSTEYDESEDITTFSSDSLGPDSQIQLESESGELSSADRNRIEQTLIRLFVFVGSIWLIIAVFTSMFGVIFSAKASNPGGAGGMSGFGSGSGGGGGGSGNQPWAGRTTGDGQPATAGSKHVHELDDGSRVVANPAGGGVVVNPNPDFGESQFDTFGPGDNPLTGSDAPDSPFNPSSPQDQVPLREKAKNIGKSGAGLADSIGQWGAEKANSGDAYDATKASAKDAASWANQAFDMDNWGQQAQDLSSHLKEERGGYLDKGAGLAVDGVAKAGSITRSIGNLGKRGAKSWYSVFKEPTVGSSIAEMQRIARSSPIGKPDSPNGNDVVYRQGQDAFTLSAWGNDSSSGNQTSTKSGGFGSGWSSSSTGSTSSSSDGRDTNSDSKGSEDVSEQTTDSFSGSEQSSAVSGSQDEELNITEEYEDTTGDGMSAGEESEERDPYDQEMAAKEEYVLDTDQVPEFDFSDYDIVEGEDYVNIGEKRIVFRGEGNVRGEPELEMPSSGQTIEISSVPGEEEAVAEAMGEALKEIREETGSLPIHEIHTDHEQYLKSAVSDRHDQPEGDLARVYGGFDSRAKETLEECYGKATQKTHRKARKQIEEGTAPEDLDVEKIENPNAETVSLYAEKLREKMKEHPGVTETAAPQVGATFAHKVDDSFDGSPVQKKRGSYSVLGWRY